MTIPHFDVFQCCILSFDSIVNCGSEHHSSDIIAYLQEHELLTVYITDR